MSITVSEKYYNEDDVAFSSLSVQDFIGDRYINSNMILITKSFLKEFEKFKEHIKNRKDRYQCLRYFSLGLLVSENYKNTPMKIKYESRYKFSECPNCQHSFDEFEEQYDGIVYQRAYSMTRCPYCGQLLNWED